MWLQRRGVLLGMMLSSGAVRADVSVDMLMFEPRAVPDVVWRQAIGFVELGGSAEVELQTWVRAPGDRSASPAVCLATRADLTRLHSYRRYLFTQSTRACCAQLLFLEGAERVKVFSRPNAEVAQRVFERKSRPVWLEVVEVREGWVKIENHFPAILGTPLNFKPEPGWIKLRDDRRRLVFWFVNPDTC